ncbi:non-hydrolyzing UDP-N-acetylglucosamine 2-epimerase [Amycolatopsis anabasis]|uniref:non-hydrolyzing UDP-N-acetylglucosamine 2-epimerase n=1 Tax=Amycolatopsis anabasis TaxID=1840409 RepID=UPI00131CE342|nr:UDP-N-acetylglucosamine 2-epimerase (non-hydrolyzing) [Amycolatopsis anabasis]
MPESVAPEVHLVVGTRPEALKVAPVIESFARRGRIRPVVVASGQHPAMVDQALAVFGLEPDVVLPVGRRAGGQADFFARLLPPLAELWEGRRPAAVLVQGDTSTAFAGGLSAFWTGLPVVHLEAGLRSHDLAAPFPEEANRRFLSVVAALHLAPTPAAARHLVNEGVPEARILVTGNTSVDAVHRIAAYPRAFAEPRLADLERRARRGHSRIVLTTIHRRESWGAPTTRVLGAVRALVAAHPDLEVVLPAHPNPAVRSQVYRELGGTERVLITDPLDYPDLMRVLSASALVLSDSGGIQEEAPTFAVPVLVLRDVTERHEAVEAGCAVLVGTDESRILAAARPLLAGPAPGKAAPAAGNPFGDGHAAERTEQAVAKLLGLTTAAPSPFRAPTGRTHGPVLPAPYPLTEVGS